MMERHDTSPPHGTPPSLAPNHGLPCDVETPERLIARVASAGDRDAFALLYRHFAPRLKSYLLSLGAPAPVADDLTQDVMLTVWNRADGFDAARASASTWIFTIARNRRIDLSRQIIRRQLDPEEPTLQAVPPPLVDQLMAEGQRDARLRAAINDLPPEQKRMLQLAFYEGMSHAQIANAENLPLGTVKSRLRLAFERLKRALDDDQ